MSELLQQLHWLDYVIFVAVLVITAGIGVFFALHGDKQRSTGEYFEGGRKLSVIPSALSLTVTYMSAIMIIGVPVEAYLYGGHYLLGVIGTALGTAVSALFIVPVFYPLQLLSVNKYLQRRYESKVPKYVATVQGAMIGVIYTAIVIFAPCSAISTMTGIPFWLVLIISSVISIFYTSIGGIKAVIWTDAFLCICMVAGLLAIVIQGIRYAGGIGQAWELNVQGGRLDIFNFDPNPAVRLTVWNMIFALGFDYTGTYGFSQSAVQRYSNVETLRKGQLTVLLTFFGNMLMYVLPVIAGLAIYAYYANMGCDPIKSGLLTNPNQLVPHFVMETLNYPGVPGLFLASLSAGSLSSVSSALNSSAAVIWDDFLKYRMPNISPTRATFICKVIVVILGCIATGICFAVIFVGGTIFQISYSFAGVTLVPTVGFFFIGLLCPWVHVKGIIIGAITGFSFVLWICVGHFFTEKYTEEILDTDISNCSSPFINGSSVTSPMPEILSSSYYNETISTLPILEEHSFLDSLYSISYLWYRCIGCTIIFVVSTIVSLITGPNKVSNVDGSLLCCCYKRRAYDAKLKYEDSRSWTQDEFYAVKKKRSGEIDSFL